MVMESKCTSFFIMSRLHYPLNQDIPIMIVKRIVMIEVEIDDDDDDDDDLDSGFQTKVSI